MDASFGLTGECTGGPSSLAAAGAGGQGSRHGFSKAITPSPHHPALPQTSHLQVAVVQLLECFDSAVSPKHGYRPSTGIEMKYTTSFQDFSLNRS